MSNRQAIEGLPVFDATAPLTVEVLDRDTAGADGHDPSNCVFARALLRQLKCGSCFVYRSRVYVLSEDGAHWERYRTPSALRDEEIAFDRGARFIPQTFTLPVLNPSARTTGRRQGSDNDKNKTGRKWAPRHVLQNVRPSA